MTYETNNDAKNEAKNNAKNNAKTGAVWTQAERGRAAQVWEGKRVLVTGGSSGLGGALVRVLDALGARVAAVARGRARLLEAVEGTRGARAIVADVSDKEATYRISAEVTDALGGPLDAVIHCASSLGPVPLRPLLDTDCEDVERALWTNVVGPFRLTKALLGPMGLHGGGWVVNVSSDAAVGAYPTWGPYGMSKAAVDHMTRVWAEETRSLGMRWVALDPGDMATPMHFDALPDADPGALRDPARVAHELALWLAQNWEGWDGPVRVDADAWREGLRAA